MLDVIRNIHHYFNLLNLIENKKQKVVIPTVIAIFNKYYGSVANVLIDNIMNPRITEVQTNNCFTLTLQFENNENQNIIA